MKITPDKNERNRITPKNAVPKKVTENCDSISPSKNSNDANTSQGKTPHAPTRVTKVNESDGHGAYITRGYVKRIQAKVS